MLIGLKSKHAVIAMINLAHLGAIHGTPTPTSLSELSARQHASVSYLEQIFADLRKENLVTSTRGPSGGYCVTSLDTTVAQIVNAVHEQPPAQSDGWATVATRVGESLNVTLRDLLV